MRHRKKSSCQRLATAVAAVSLAVSAMPAIRAIAMVPTTAGAYNGERRPAGTTYTTGGHGNGGGQDATANASATAVSANPTDQTNLALATGGTGGTGVSGTALGGHSAGAAGGNGSA